MGIAENWSRENLAWAGGYFEGEGCITITGNPKREGRAVRLKATSTDIDVLKRFRNIIGAGSISGPYSDKKHPHWKPKWYFDLHGGYRCYPVLVAIWPFLGKRRQQRACEAIAYFSAQRVYKNAVSCGSGHPYTAENTAIWGGRRACRACCAERNKKKRLAANGPGHIRESKNSGCLSSP